MNCKALLNIAIEIALYKYCIIVLYWHSDRSNYSEQQIGEMPTWIKNMKESIYQALPENYQNVNLATLSEMQALAYNIVQSHYNDLSPNK